MLRITFRCIHCFLSLKKRYCFKAIACWTMLTLILFGPVISNALRYDAESESQSGSRQSRSKTTKDEATDNKQDTSGENTVMDPPKNDASDQHTSRTEDFAALEIYQRLFQQKRKSHMEALKRITEFGGYEKQYKMVDLLLEKLFAVVTESKASLLSVGFLPGDPFPASETTREILSKVVENTAFFGDLLLRFPDITHNLLKKNRDWGIIANWAVGFCMEAEIIVGPDSKMLQLAAQELELIPKDPNYRNPYKLDMEKQNKEIKEQLDALLNADSKNKKKQEKKKNKLKKGPKLSTIRHSEL